jgi:hypothetical protein
MRNLLTFISGFRRDVGEVCGLLGYYTASCGNYLPTFRDNVSVPSSRVKIPSRNLLFSIFGVEGENGDSKNCLLGYGNVFGWVLVVCQGNLLSPS